MNRRNFLKTGVIATSLAAAPSIVLAKDEKISAKNMQKHHFYHATLTRVLFAFWLNN